MNFFEEIGATIVASFSELFDKLIGFIPALIAALIILVIGLVISGALGRLVRRLVELTKIDSLLSRIDIISRINKSGGKFQLSEVIGWLVKWFLIIVTLIAVADILQLDSFNDFLIRIAEYFPQVVVAVLILVAGIVFGNGVADVIEKIVTSSSLRVGRIVATIAKWAIVIFSVMAALIQLQIAATLINTLFTGIVFMLALAGGLAFGLGGKEGASQLISSLRDEMKG